MLGISPAVRIYQASEPVDMRKGFDGLLAIVENLLGEDVYDGNLFVFVFKRGDHVKILYWDRSGFCIWAKRLEKRKRKRVGVNPQQYLADVLMKIQTHPAADIDELLPDKWKPPGTPD